MSYLPMAGVRIIEVAQFTYTPAAGAVLAAWGADVIKVEHAVTGDAQRGLNVGPAGWSEGRFHPIMEHPNQGKRSIGLALDHPGGNRVLRDLVRGCDVFLTNFLPDARARLGIDVDHLRELNERLIYVRGSAFGAKGPEAGKGGFDSSAFWARSGAAFSSTPLDYDGVLGMPGPAFGDSMGAMTIAGAIAGALFGRERTGTPAVVDVSLLSVGAWAMGLAVDLSLAHGEAWMPASTGTAGTPTNPVMGAFRTSDDRHIYLAILQPGRYWADLCRHLDRPDLIDDPRCDTAQSLMAHAPELALEVARKIAEHPYAYWLARLQTLDGQWAPVQNSAELAADPQLRANGYISALTDADGRPRELVANPVQFDEEPAELRRAPQFAEHTDEILRELGRSEDEIIELKLAGAVT